MVEQLTFNQLALGSIPRGFTIFTRTEIYFSCHNTSHVVSSSLIETQRLAGLTAVEIDTHADFRA